MSDIVHQCPPMSTIVFTWHRYITPEVKRAPRSQSLFDRSDLRLIRDNLSLIGYGAVFILSKSPTRIKTAGASFYICEAMKLKYSYVLVEIY